MSINNKFSPTKSSKTDSLIPCLFDTVFLVFDSLLLFGLLPSPKGITSYANSSFNTLHNYIFQRLLKYWILVMIHVMRFVCLEFFLFRKDFIKFLKWLLCSNNKERWMHCFCKVSMNVKKDKLKNVTKHATPTKTQMKREP